PSPERSPATSRSSKRFAGKSMPSSRACDCAWQARVRSIHCYAPAATIPTATHDREAGEVHDRGKSPDGHGRRRRGRARIHNAPAQATLGWVLLGVATGRRRPPGSFAFWCNRVELRADTHVPILDVEDLLPRLEASQPCGDGNPVEDGDLRARGRLTDGDAV